MVWIISSYIGLITSIRINSFLYTIHFYYLEKRFQFFVINYLEEKNVIRDFKNITCLDEEEFVIRDFR